MECEQYRLKRIDCDQLKKLIYFPCSDVRETRPGATALTVPGSNNEKSIHKLECKAHQLLPPETINLPSRYHINLIVQMNFRTQTEYHYGQIFIAGLAFLKTHCFYIGKYPFNWSYQYYKEWVETHPYINLLTISNLWPIPRDVRGDPINDIGTSVRLTKEGLPDIKLSAYLKQMTPAEIKENYNDQQQWIISEWKARWKRYDLEHRVCVEKYENIGRAVEIRATGQIGTLTDIRIVRPMRKIYIVTLPLEPQTPQWLADYQFKYTD